MDFNRSSCWQVFCNSVVLENLLVKLQVWSVQRYKRSASQASIFKPYNETLDSQGASDKKA